MQIQTVLGPVAPGAIGPTRSHDFLLTEQVLADAARFKAAGGSAIVEMRPIDRDRDPERMVKLAQSADLHIVAATGFHDITRYSDTHWIHAYTEEDIAGLVCDELESGMDVHNYSGPLVRRTTARAGVIQVGTRGERFNDVERKLLRVAAMAHHKTGAPIITRTSEGQLALEQIAFLAQQGVKPNRIALTRMDRRADVVYHKEIASTGALLGYDALPRAGNGFDRSTLRLILEMADAGYSRNLLLGGGISRQGNGQRQGGEPGLDFVVGGFKSALTGAGLPEDALDAIYVRNPRMFLAWGRETTAGRPKLRTVSSLMAHGMVAPEDQPALQVVASRFSIALTPDVAALVDGAAPDDPIGRQFVPSPAELRVEPLELTDPIGDEVHARTKAIIHRYPDRVLLKPAHACPVYCRFCFRREAVGPAAEAISESDLDDALSYIRSQPRIWEVILTGGDPLILSDRRLRGLFSALHAIEHVEVIRVHTRYPVADPRRITGELARAMRGRAAVYVVLHCNHPRELTADARAACDRLIDKGIPMLAQTVLLRGVNDDPETMTELMRALVRLRIKPYYLHHLDLARGTGHFRTTVAKGQDIVRRMRGRVSGLCQPTYVLDIPGGHGKVPIGPIYLRPDRGGVRYAIEDYQGEHHAYVDPAEG